MGTHEWTGMAALGTNKQTQHRKVIRWATGTPPENSGWTQGIAKGR